MAEPSVYYIQQGADGPIKIGFAWSPIVRLHDFQCANPIELHLLGTTKTEYARELEHALHKQLRKHRVRGEWFYPSRPVLKAIRDHMDPPRARPAFYREPNIEEYLRD